MDYKKKYKEALERAKEKYPACYSPALLEYIFPEIKESKDEKIKKSLISYLRGLGEFEYPDKKTYNNWLVWLEKQGEQSDANKEYWRGYREGKKEILNKYSELAKQGEQKSIDNLTPQEAMDIAVVKCFDEQKTADEVKPKFKVGDWISNDMCDAHIASIENGMYYFDEGDGLSIVFVDEHYHLWTIEDAMDGDVLVSRSTFIYGKQCPYGGLNWCNNKFIKASNFIFTDSPVHPATKEQRDFLFQKMKEAGYTFDFKNKELKKIKNDIEIPFGAKDSELQEATYYIPKGFYAEIDDDKVVIKKGEKPAEWSKKDEKMFEYALNMIEWYSGKNEDKSRYVSDWLKSLKQRIGG